jgi:cytochrome P450
VTDPWLGCNPLDSAFRNDPHASLHHLRQADPVNLTPIGIWRLTRYDDVVHLLKNVPCGVRSTEGQLPFAGARDADRPGRFMLQQDPPAHTRLRKLVSRAFTPRAVEALRPRIEKIVGECLDRVEAQRAEGRTEMDVIADLALPVPSTVICEMMDVPLADRETFTVWTSQATHALAVGIAPPAVIEAAHAAGDKLAEYFQHEELLAQSIGLLIAGFETTIGLIGNGVRALLRHPDELAKLRAHPELVDCAVDECLRFDGPIPLTVRVLHADAEFGGKTLPCNSVVWAMLLAANRDPARFSHPDRLDVARDPNPHLAFGGGTHLCLGTHLARLEGRLAIGSLVQRFPRLSLVSESVEWGASLFRVPGRLPVSIG